MTFIFILVRQTLDIMSDQQLGINTICVHTGEVTDTQFKGAVSPVFMATSYAFDGVDVKRYPDILTPPIRRH